MNFKKNVFIMSVFLMAAGANAQTYSDVARASRSTQGSIKIGSAVWVNNLCKRITEQGISNEVIEPLSKAIETCPARRDYGKVEEAYAKLEAPANCSEIDLKKEDAGTICVTSKGGQFKTVANGIQDVESGLIIMNEIKAPVNQYEATDYCKEKGQRLPTKEEFIALEKRGFREAFAGDMRDKYFWSSSVHPASDDFAYDFLGSVGLVGGGDRGYRDNNDSARCVSASGVN